MTEARDAFSCWMEAHIQDGRPVPEPGGASVRFMQRLPKSVHAQLKCLAATDGVSMNTMATVLIAEGIGRRQANQGS